MIYKVKANLIEERIGEFYRKLTDGTVAKQRPMERRSPPP
jgi:hypothetical protein